MSTALTSIASDSLVQAIISNLLVALQLMLNTWNLHLFIRYNNFNKFQFSDWLPNTHYYSLTSLLKKMHC